MGLVKPGVVWKLKKHCAASDARPKDLIHAPTKWAKAVMNTFESMWEWKLVGIIVRDGENTPLVVNQL
eukprot:8589179-Lingulodinium_polyedra.AAC.1